MKGSRMAAFSFHGGGIKDGVPGIPGIPPAEKFQLMAQVG